MIVEAHKAAAENNKAIMVIWVLLAVFGSVVTIFNAFSLPAFNETLNEIKLQLERPLSNRSFIFGRFVFKGNSPLWSVSGLNSWSMLQVLYVLTSCSSLFFDDNKLTVFTV